ncbi:hypothetical protein BZM27_09310 [Paraburkholderia steynii]|uniref:Uncharacterized protein n=1 Tax=Paraburkholderia steynii TaxID=1245441 RepID=A0A4V2NHH5_9BURK|nr:hypothetical protein BZM27_09310 [Paraburkholderia steynii]
MPRPADPQRFDALNVIRKYVREHGEQEGQRLAKLDGYKHINKATWSQWCKLVREEDRQLAVDVILNVPRPDMPAGQANPITPITPATPEKRATVWRAINFFACLNDMIADANLLAEYAAPTDANGVRKIRNPVMLVQAHRAKALNMQLALKHAEAAWNIQRFQNYEEVIAEMVKDAIKDEAPVVRARIVAGLREAREVRREQISDLTSQSTELFFEPD